MWDSSDADEFRECSTKARILTSPPPEFRLLETMLWTSGEGYFLLDRHLDRLTQSAGYFDFTVDAQSVREQLDALAKRLGNAPERVRLLLARAGAIALESAPLTPGDAAKRRRVFLARAPVNSQDAFLYHKTTNRRVYQEALAARSGYDDVLLWNEKGEVTESCIANVVVERDGRWVTPPVRCGLLGGVYRGWMIDQGLVQEDVIRVDELPFCSRIFLINSVRKQEEVLVDLGMEGGVLR